jgi:antitoxin component YwqK of YwqJK toxin-antitoxin module
MEEFYDDGHLKARGTLRNDMREGFSEEWLMSEHGYCRLAGQYQNGKREGAWEFFDFSDSFVETKAFYQNGMRTGTWLDYNEKGEVIGKRPFISDLPHGNWEHVAWTGKIHRKSQYHNGKLHGFVEEFEVSTGILTKRTSYLNDKEEGTSFTFHRSGSIRSSLPMSAGQLHGIKEEFNESGVLTFKGNYVNGKEVGDHLGFDDFGRTIHHSKFIDGSLTWEYKFVGIGGTNHYVSEPNKIDKVSNIQWQSFLSYFDVSDNLLYIYKTRRDPSVTYDVQRRTFLNEKGDEVRSADISVNEWFEKGKVTKRETWIHGVCT